MSSPGVDRALPMAQTGEISQAELGQAITVETAGTVGKVGGKVLRTFATSFSEVDLKGTEPLLRFYVEHVEGYLRDGRSSGSALRSPTQAGRLFSDLFSLLPGPAREVAEELRAKCDIRRQLDRQEQLNNWLHWWLLIHLPTSVALTVLLCVHVWSALKYW